MKLGIWLASLAALLIGCKAPASATEVLVLVNADRELAAKLDRLNVRVYERGSETPSQDRPIAVETEDAMVGEFPLPLSFSLAPEAGVRRFRLVVTGQRKLDGSFVDIVEQTALGTFADGKKMSLLIYLDNLCEGLLCREPGAGGELRTCEVGICETAKERVLTPASSDPLDHYDGGKPQRDGGPGDGGPDGSRDAGPDADLDASPDSGPDATIDATTDAARDAGPDAELDANVDAGPQPCGTWVSSNKDAEPPATGFPYGKEFNDTGDAGVWNQFVCRVQVGNTYYPGKGVYGYACYYVTLDNQYAYADNFDVLVDSYDCARMKPVREVDSAWLLPTGSTPSGPLYSCIDKRPSNKIDPTPQTATSYPLGRYDVANDRCVYEWYDEVRFSQVDGDGLPTYSVLTR